MTGMLPPPGLPPLTPTCEQWHHGGHAGPVQQSWLPCPRPCTCSQLQHLPEPAGPRAAGRSRAHSWGLASAKGGPPPRFMAFWGLPGFASSRRCSPVAQSPVQLPPLATPRACLSKDS